MRNRGRGQMHSGLRCKNVCYPGELPGAGQVPSHRAFARQRLGYSPPVSGQSQYRQCPCREGKEPVTAETARLGDRVWGGAFSFLGGWCSGVFRTRVGVHPHPVRPRRQLDSIVLTVNAAWRADPGRSDGPTDIPSAEHLLELRAGHTGACVPGPGGGGRRRQGAHRQLGKPESTEIRRRCPLRQA